MLPTPLVPLQASAFDVANSARLMGRGRRANDASAYEPTSVAASVR
jgi:hypothetical protein